MTAHTDGDDPRLADLLLRWEELHDQGRSLSAEELCSTCPELAEELGRRIALLRQLDPLLDGTATAEGDHPRPEPSAPRRASATARADFHDLRFHAAGGLGEVFMARNAELNREVALKFLKAERTHDADSLRRFLQEAEVTGRLEHPGVVPIYALGTDPDGSPCYAMRFIRGSTLQDAIDAFHAAEEPGRDPSERSLSLRELLNRFVSICNTMGYAHSRGILHRDLKPRNVMLGKYDETLVVDWGLAKPFERDEVARSVGEETLTPASGSGESGSDTPTVGVVGTPAYMSPEQAEARWDLVGPASDLFGLGGILYAILTGQAPYQGRKVGEILEKVKRCEFPAPRQVKPDVSRSLEAICLKSMARRPEGRYASALDLAADVRRWLADEPVSAYSEPLSSRARRWMRRHRTLVTTLAATVVVAMVSLGIAYSHTSGINRRLDAASRQVSETNAKLIREAEALERERDRADEGERAARWNLYAARIKLIQEVVAAGRIEQARELLDALRPLPGQGDLRDFEWYYLWRLCHADRSVLRARGGPIAALAISPDGRTLAAAGSEQSVTLWDLTSRRVRRTIRGLDAPVVSLAFSHGGRSLVTNAPKPEEKGGKIQVWDAATGDLKATCEPGRPVLSMAISADGKTLAMGLADGRVALHDGESLRELRAFPVHRPPVQALAFSPDGATVASTGVTETFVILSETATGKRRSVLEGQTGTINGLLFSPDGKTLVSAGAGSGGERGGGDLWLWDIPTNRLRSRLKGHENSIVSVALSPDGKTLASTAGDGTARLWDMMTGRSWAILTGHTGPVFCASFSPDGRSVATGGQDGTIRLWDAARRHAGRVGSAAISPDGRTVAAGQDDGTLLIWDVASGGVRDTLVPHSGPVAALAFSPDGRQLATGGGDADVALWDPGSARELARFDAAAGPVTVLAFSPTGSMLAAAGRNRLITLWDVATRERRGTLTGHSEPVSSLAFRSDGKALATGDEGGAVMIWDVAEHRKQHALSGGGGKVLALAWGKGDKALASSGEDGRLRFWDPATGRPTGNPRVTVGAITAGAFTSAGPSLALGTEYGLIRFPAGTVGPELIHAHFGGVTALSYAGDGKLLLSGGEDGTVKLWQPDGRLATALPGGPIARHAPRGSRLGDGRLHDPLPTIRGFVWSLDFSRDGRTLASASGEQFISEEGGYVALWDVTSGRQKDVFAPRGDPITALDYLKGGSILAVADFGGAVMLREAATGREVATLRGHSPGYQVMAANPGGSILATAGGSADTSGRIKLWDAGTARELATLQGHAAGVTALAFSPDGMTLASGSNDKTIRLWDVAARRELAALHGHTANVLSLAFAPDGKTLASGDGDPASPAAPATIRLWDLETRRERSVLKGHTAGVRGLRFAPGGGTLASGGWDGVVHLWDMPSGARRATLPAHPRQPDLKKPVFALSFSPDGAILAVTSEVGAVALWQVATAKELATLEGHRGAVQTVAFSPDGATLASGGRDAAVVLWDVATRKERAVIHGAVGPGRAVAMASDGSILAARFSGGLGAGRRLEGATLLWDLPAKSERAVIQGDILALGAWNVETGRLIALSPDGSTLAMPAGARAAEGNAPESAVGLWDTATGQLRARFMTGSTAAACLAFSPDGRALAAGCWDGSVSVWDLPAGTRRASVRGHKGLVLSIAFAPGGTALATSGDSRDGAVKVWDLGKDAKSTLVERGAFRGHTADVWSIAFSPSGRVLASASGDGTVKIIDVATFQERATFPGDSAHMTAVAFSPDGKTLAAGGYNLIQFWDAAGDDEVDAPE